MSRLIQVRCDLCLKMGRGMGAHRVTELRVDVHQTSLPPEPAQTIPLGHIQFDVCQSCRPQASSISEWIAMVLEMYDHKDEMNRIDQPSEEPE